MKKIAIDAYYVGNTCHVVGGIFNKWRDEHVSKFIYADIKVDSEYIPGEFYKRELPGILKLLEQIDLNEFDTIIVDGYVYLYDENEPDGRMYKSGLGKMLHYVIRDSYPKIKIIGIAKTLYGDKPNLYGKCYRGLSSKPLFITTDDLYYTLKSKRLIGYIQRMAGNYRIPTIIKEVDTETKKVAK